MRRDDGAESCYMAEDVSGEPLPERHLQLLEARNGTDYSACAHLCTATPECVRITAILTRRVITEPTIIVVKVHTCYMLGIARLREHGPWNQPCPSSACTMRYAEKKPQASCGLPAPPSWPPPVSPPQLPPQTPPAVPPANFMGWFAGAGGVTSFILICLLMVIVALVRRSRRLSRLVADLREQLSTSTTLWQRQSQALRSRRRPGRAWELGRMTVHVPDQLYPSDALPSDAFPGPPEPEQASQSQLAQAAMARYLAADGTNNAPLTSGSSSPDGRSSAVDDGRSSGDAVATCTISTTAS